MVYTKTKNKTCFFTGHRKIPEEKEEMIRRKLKNEIKCSIENGYRYFGAGGARGFDTIAAQIVLQLKRKHSDIRLILVLPCLNQTINWSKEDILEFERIKSNADKVVYTSTKYTVDCMFKRNRHLVKFSSLCICYLTECSGGTAYTVNQALGRGLNIINIAKLI